MESMKRMVTGQGLEENRGETGDQVARLEEADEKEKCERVMAPDNSSTEECRNGKETAERSSSEDREDRGIVIEIEGEDGTEGHPSRRQIEVQKLCSGAPILANKSCKKNLDSPMGNELDLQQGDVLSFILEHEDNEHWWLAEDNKGQVGYVPVAYMMIVMDETVQEDGYDKTGKEGQEKSTDGAKIGGEKGQDGERIDTYSAVVIVGIKRNSTK